jgi:hypothetical protein
VADASGELLLAGLLNTAIACTVSSTVSMCPSSSSQRNTNVGIVFAPSFTSSSREISLRPRDPESLRAGESFSGGERKMALRLYPEI